MPDYLITVTVPRVERTVVTERLVRAKNQARAIAHVVADTVVVNQASADDIVRLTKAGVEIETAA